MVKKKKPTSGLGKLRLRGKRIMPPIAFEPADYAIVQEAAEMAGAPVSQYVRNTVVKAAKEAVRKEREA